MSSSLKCFNFDGTALKNKCPPSNKPNQVYCNTDTGNCYAETKDSLPWGFKKYKEKNPDTIYDKALKLFGGREEVTRHQRVLQASINNAEESQKMISKSELNRKSLETLKQIASSLGISVLIYKTKENLISKILVEQERRRSIAERSAFLLAEGVSERKPLSIIELIKQTAERPSTSEQVYEIIEEEVSEQPLTSEQLYNIEMIEEQPDIIQPEPKIVLKPTDDETPITPMTPIQESIETPTTSSTFEKKVHREEVMGEFSLIADTAVTNYKIRDYIPITLSDIKEELRNSFRLVHVV